MLFKNSGVICPEPENDDRVDCRKQACAQAGVLPAGKPPLLQSRWTDNEFMSTFIFLVSNKPAYSCCVRKRVFTNEALCSLLVSTDGNIFPYGNSDHFTYLKTVE